MYGLNDLKSEIKIDGEKVECPVKGCSKKVHRQRKTFKREEIFFCHEHKIYISPSTFEYETEKENLLWTDIQDEQHFNEIKKVKRESRISRDNSEDALTWNVFRFLDKQKILSNFLSQLSGIEINESELILWSYSPSENSTWTLLNKARIEFGETITRGSEPDIIIKTDKVLYFIEAKLNAGNKTKPRDIQNRKKYETGGNELFSKIFKFDYEKIVKEDRRYELMRFWLLGCWIAEKLNLEFEFYSLVKKTRETDIETEFGKHINQSDRKKFARLTWEQIYDYIKTLENTEKQKLMIDYFVNKTVGYTNGKLKKAFDF